MVKLKLVRGDDWEGLYIGDNLYEEDHVLGGEVYLNLINNYKINIDLNGQYEVYYIDQEWLELAGSLPNKFSNIDDSLLELQYKSK